MVEEGLCHSRRMDYDTKKKCLEEQAMNLKRREYSSTFRHQVIKATVGEDVQNLAALFPVAGEGE